MWGCLGSARRYPSKFDSTGTPAADPATRKSLWIPLRTFALLFAKFVDFREDSAGKLGCYFGECIDVGVAGGQQSSDDSLTSLGEVIPMCGAYFA